MNCIDCKNDLVITDKYCSNCGRYVEDDIKAENSKINLFKKELTEKLENSCRQMQNAIEENEELENTSAWKKIFLSLINFLIVITALISLIIALATLLATKADIFMALNVDTSQISYSEGEAINFIFAIAKSYFLYSAIIYLSLLVYYNKNKSKKSKLIKQNRIMKIYVNNNKEIIEDINNHTLKDEDISA